jgi:hypothetical protein
MVTQMAFSGSFFCSYELVVRGHFSSVLLRVRCVTFHHCVFLSLVFNGWATRPLSYFPFLLSMNHNFRAEWRKLLSDRISVYFLAFFSRLNLIHSGACGTADDAEICVPDDVDHFNRDLPDLDCEILKKHALFCCRISAPHVIKYRCDGSPFGRRFVSVKQIEYK